MKKKSDFIRQPDVPYPECKGCEMYWWSGRNMSIVFLYGVDGSGKELEQRVKCKANTHYCRHPRAVLHELTSISRWFCIKEQ